MLDPNRGTGRTTKQMLDAPQGAVFISARTATLDYDRNLARKHGRADIKVVAPSWLTNLGWAGRVFTAIVIDHDARLSAEERHALEVALTRVRK